MATRVVQHGSAASRRPVPGYYGADPDDPAHQLDPYPGYRQLRETQPVNLTPTGLWRLTRYEDCVRLLRHSPAGMRLTNGQLPGQSKEEAELGPPSFMLLQDPPTHTRLRKLVSRGFTPRAVEAWRPRIESITRALIDNMAQKGSAELIADLARPVPATLICELMGVPTEDHENFAQWTTDATHGLLTSRGEGTPEVKERVERAGLALAGYFDQLIDSRKGGDGNGLIDVLIAAEEDGDRLSQVELLTTCIGLMVAGFETTIGLIGNGLITLIQHPDQLNKLKRSPDLIESAVEECLRYCGPILATVRVLHEAVSFDGIEIPRDAEVLAVIGEANRDPDHYTDPESFDVERWAREPAPPAHLSFGGGVHFCLGAHLARLEAQAAIGAFVERFGEVSLLNRQTQWGRSLFRVPARIPVHLKTSPGPLDEA